MVINKKRKLSINKFQGLFISKSVNDLGYYYLSSILIALLGLIIRVVYSRSLSVSEFGIFFSAISFFTLVSSITVFGLDKSVSYFFAKFYSKSDFVSARKFLISMYGFLLVTQTIFLFVWLSLSDYLSLKLLGSASYSFIINYFAIFFFVNSFLMPITQLFVANQKYLYSQVFYIFRLIIIIVISLGAILLSPDKLLESYTYIWLISISISSLLYVVFIYLEEPILFKKMERFSFHYLKKMLNYGFFSVFTGIGIIVLSQIDIIVISSMVSPSAAGIYGNAFAIFGVATLLLLPFSKIMLPLFSKYSSEKNYGAMKRIFSSLYTTGIFIISAVLLGISLFSNLIITILFSETYLPSAKVISIISLFGIFYLLYQYNLDILSGLGDIARVAKLVFIAAIINFILDIVLVGLFGMIGAAYATSASWIFVFAVSSVMILKHSFIIHPWGKYLKTIFVSALYALITYSFISKINLSVYGSAGFFVFFTSIYFLIGIRYELLQIDLLIKLIPFEIPFLHRLVNKK